MHWVPVPNYEAMSQAAAARLAAVVQAKAGAGMAVAVGLATGKTMVRLYELLAARLNAAGVDLSRLLTFNLDEYLGPAGDWLDAGHPLSYRGYMRRHLFGRLRPELGFRPANARFPEATCPERYDAEIAARGGLDALLLGLGFNGHIAFNEPIPEARLPLAAFADLPSRVVELAPLTRQTNARLTASDDLRAVPTRAVTMGMRSILAAREILLLTCFAEQAVPLAALRTGPVSGAVPVTCLRDHPNLTVISATECIA